MQNIIYFFIAAIEIRGLMVIIMWNKFLKSNKKIIISSLPHYTNDWSLNVMKFSHVPVNVIVCLLT